MLEEGLTRLEEEGKGLAAATEGDAWLRERAELSDEVHSLMREASAVCAHLHTPAHLITGLSKSGAVFLA